MKKISSSMLKSLWLFAVVLVIMISSGLPIWLLVTVLILLLALPLLREITHRSDADERQIYISHYSSHLALYVFVALILFVMIHDYQLSGTQPDVKFYMLLLVPLVIKFIISLLQNYGAGTAGRWIGYFFASVWLLFALLDHGFSLMGVIQALPFIVLFALAWYSKKQPLICGILYIVLALAGLFFFKGWIKMGIYGLILMYTLVPLPVFISGTALVFSSIKKEELQ